MVGVRRFELLTSSVSGKRSPPELNARISAAGVAARSILRENAHVTQPSIASFSRITNTAQREGRGEGPRRQAGLRRRQTRPSQRPQSQTCGLVAVRREGPSRLPAVLLGNVVARVLVTRRFPSGEETGRAVAGNNRQDWHRTQSHSPAPERRRGVTFRT